MHNHSNKDGGHGGMPWMMIPCLLLLGFLLFGGGTLSSSGYFWPVLIGAFVVAHFWMMRRGHRGHGGNNTEDKIGVSAKQSEKKGEDEKHKHKDCCH